MVDLEKGEGTRDSSSGQSPSTSDVVEPPSLHLDIAAVVEHAVERISSLLDSRARADKFQQDLITKLHDELQEQSSRSAVLPIVTAIMRIQEEMEKQDSRLKASPELATPERMLLQFRQFAEDLRAVLEQAGVREFVDEALGDRFNPHRQQIIGRDLTNDRAKSQMISQRVRPGADFGKILLLREAVKVYSFDANTTNSEKPSDASLEIESED